MIGFMLKLKYVKLYYESLNYVLCLHPILDAIFIFIHSMAHTPYYIFHLNYNIKETTLTDAQWC